MESVRNGMEDDVRSGLSNTMGDRMNGLRQQDGREQKERDRQERDQQATPVQGPASRGRLRLILGRARSGKTARMIAEVRDMVRSRQGRALVLVPEQYSHEAERELCLACGDGLSLHGEVMSFTGFARWGRSVYGGGAKRWMDQGGKLLCLALALQELEPVLRLYGDAGKNPELQAVILQELESVRQADLGSGALRGAAEELGGELAGKLRELATVLEAYEGMMERSGFDSGDPLALLARQLEAKGLREFTRVYVDGFLDFTGLEAGVLRALMARGTDLTVLLPDAPGRWTEEHLLLSQVARAQLEQAAEELGLPVEKEWVEDPPAGDGPEPDTLRYFAEHMFDYGAESVPAQPGRLKLQRCESPALECEAAACEALRAVRDEGLRWRDVAVAARGFSDYRGLLESAFRRYGVPLFVTRRDPVAEKPLAVWISCAYDMILGDWDVDAMTAYLHCGFSGLEAEEVDALCSYLFLWQLKAPAWLRKSPWRQHPDGYGRPVTEESVRRLEQLNALRARVAGPLLLLKARSEAASDALGQAEALLSFLAAELPARLQARIGELEAEGQAELRAEYLQLWDVLTEAVSQMGAVLGRTPMDAQGFSRLLKAVLNTCDIGMIPVSLDRVSAGDFDRMRRRNIRRLIVLGCHDGRLPPAGEPGGLFTQDERDRLAGLGLKLGGGEAELWREYALIYHTLTLPREQLVLSCPEVDFSGAPQAPALVFSLAERMFSLPPERPRPDLLRLNALAPALSLALTARAPGAGDGARAAERWFLRRERERFLSLRQAALVPRGSLSGEAVAALYGRRLRMSPSRVERFAGCRFRYFMEYGLRARPFEPAGFRPPEIGSFTHYVLERVARAAQEQGGFARLDDGALRALTEAAVERYVEETLGGFEEKSARFRTLFRRLGDGAFRIVRDMAEELRRSDFQPLSFELDVSALEGGGRAGAAKLTGIADRVDGCRDGDALYLRVVDYKTGGKQFHLYDVPYGRNLQMLLYLFEICDHAEQLYGEAAVPAGIEYVPAREGLLHFEGEPSPEDEAAGRRKEKRRSGLVLSEPAVLAAWERGDEQQFTPQKTRVADPFLTREQMNLLRRQTGRCLREMAEAVAGGRIEANPLWVSEGENECQTCQAKGACRFAPGENGEDFRPVQKRTDAEVLEWLGDDGEAGE